MMRCLWHALVPGTQMIICFWLFCIGIDIYFERGVALLLIDATLFALNLYSWDYQRRHGGGK